MNVHALSIMLVNPTEGAAAPTMYFMAQHAMTVVGVSVAPSTDDDGADIDIADDGTDVITAVDASDQDVPGEWQATGFGGSNDPVHIAAGSKVSIVPNDNANGTAFLVVIYYLPGTVPG